MFFCVHFLIWGINKPSLHSTCKCTLDKAADPSVYSYEWIYLNTGTAYNTQEVINPVSVPGLNSYQLIVRNAPVWYNNRYCSGLGKSTCHHRLDFSWLIYVGIRRYQNL
jgi:hypothetical protein